MASTNHAVGMIQEHHNDGGPTTYSAWCDCGEQIADRVERLFRSPQSIAAGQSVYELFDDHTENMAARDVAPWSAPYYERGDDCWRVERRWTYNGVQHIDGANLSPLRTARERLETGELDASLRVSVETAIWMNEHEPDS